MPGISDPGHVLIKKLIEKNLDFRVLPGPNAALSALVISGLANDNFYFYGFTNPKSSSRKKEFENLKNIRATLIFYESPHRIIEFLKDMREILGNREISISRELTKIYEETLRGKVEDILNSNLTLKGEFVIVVEGNTQKAEMPDIKELLIERINNGQKKSQAVKEIAQEYNISKNVVYKESLNIDA